MATQVQGHAIDKWGLFSFAFGNIVGVGWIVAVSSWIVGAGTLGAVLAFCVGALLAAIIGLCYSEVGAMLPLPGGEIAYAQNILGPRTSLFAGWILAFFFLTLNAFEFVSIGWIWGALAPGLRGPALYTVLGEQIYTFDLLISTAILIAIAVLNARGGFNSALFQKATTGLLIGLTLLLGLVGIAFGNVENVTPLFRTSSEGWSYGGFFAVLATTPFWFGGFAILPQALSERSDAVSAQTIKSLIVYSILGAGLFYAVLILGVAMAAPQEAYVDGVLPSAEAFAYALDHPVGRIVVLLTGFVGLVTTWNAVFMGLSRVSVVLSRPVQSADRFADFDQRELLISTVIIVPVVFAYGLLGRGGVSPFINSCGFANCVLYAITLTVLLVARAKRPNMPRPVRLKYGVLWATLGLLIAFGMMTLSALEFSVLDNGLILEATILSAWTGLGVILYFLTRRRPAAEGVSEP